MLDFEPLNASHLDGSNSVHRQRPITRARYFNADGPSAEQIDATVKAATALGTTIANARANSPKVQAKKDMKSVCGKKPVLKKNRGSWDKCVADFTKQKTETIAPEPSAAPEKPSSKPSASSYAANSSKKSGKILGMDKGLAIGLGTLVVVGGGLFVYFKFIKKGSVAVAAPAI